MMFISGIMRGSLNVTKGCMVEIHGIAKLDSVINFGRIDVFGIVACPPDAVSALTIQESDVIKGI